MADRAQPPSSHKGCHYGAVRQPHAATKADRAQPPSSRKGCHYGAVRLPAAVRPFLRFQFDLDAAQVLLESLWRVHAGLEGEKTGKEAWPYKLQAF